MHRLFNCNIYSIVTLIVHEFLCPAQGQGHTHTAVVQVKVVILIPLQCTLDLVTQKTVTKSRGVTK